MNETDLALRNGFLVLSCIAIGIPAVWGMSSLACRIRGAVRFKIQVWRMGVAHGVRHPESWYGEWFSRKYPLRRLILSSRPLSLERWYSREELNEIRR